MGMQGMKVEPLTGAFRVVHFWVTCQRKDESPGYGSSILVVQREHSFERTDVGIGRLVKSNSVTNVDTCRFFQAMNVPVNSLRAPGYVTVVCEPCARSVSPWQQEREAKWWWEDDNAKGCGLYKEKIKQEMARLGEHKNGVGSRTTWRTTITDAFNAPCLGICQAMEVSYVELAEKVRPTLGSSGLIVGTATWRLSYIFA